MKPKTWKPVLLGAALGCSLVCGPGCSSDGGAPGRSGGAGADAGEHAAAPAKAPPAAGARTDAPDPASLYALQTRTLAGEDADLAEHAGQVTLVVNVASECGLTPQYEGLQALHTSLAPRGFAVLGFPCNDFGGQEPGTPEQIQSFCTANYGVTFPIYEKIQTKAGAGQSPVYARLQAMTGQLTSWNFGKYVVSKDGLTVAYFDPRTPPDDPALLAAIESALAE